jgi:hypothetical protein
LEETAFKSATINCNPPKGQSFEHHILGKNRWITRRIGNPERDIKAIRLSFPEKTEKKPLKIARGSKIINNGNPDIAAESERMATHFPTSGKRLYVNDL